MRQAPPKKMTVQDFILRKKQNSKISMVTCYDFASAQIINATAIDCVLIGDSCAMVMHGHNNTIPATIDLIATHTRAVACGAPQKFLIADMPFLSARKSQDQTFSAVDQLMKAGCQAIKIEGVYGQEEVITAIIQSGVPVMGHLGMTPQSVHKFGGFRLQGKNSKDAEEISDQAKTLERLGCFAVVLECIPEDLASKITAEISIPTIGIGAGVGVDGQVLVWHDLLGLNRGFTPRFVKTYLQGSDLIEKALNEYDHDVKAVEFPKREHSFRVMP